MKSIKIIFAVTITTLFLQSCGVYDLRNENIKRNGISQENTEKGKMILEKAWQAQHFDKLNEFSTYSFHGKDTWKGFLGGIGKVWKDKKSELDFKYRIKTFDGQVTFLDGKDKGISAGLQDWNYYEIANSNATFSDKNLKKNKRKVFGIAAYQYFTEMIDRFKNAPIISYAGEQDFRGESYDLVFCTWVFERPHMEHDQYIAWVNKKTGFMDFAQYTIRESYLKTPGYKSIGGAVEFKNFKNIDGVMIPHEQIVYAIKMKEKPNKNLHRLLISDFKFDDFEEADLQIDTKISLGDASKK